MFGRCAQINENGGDLITVPGFHIGRFPVTQGQWYAVMGNTPSFFTGANVWGGGTAPETFERDDLPVEQVSWYDVLVFANRLSIQDGLQPAYRINNSTDPDDWGDIPTASDADWNDVEIVAGANGWRLPTEHQWEFAAKGGRLSAGFTGTDSDTYFIFSGSDDADEVAWYSGNSGNRTHPVGEKEPNELGLYDMSGNVWEWAWDRRTPEGVTRVQRGGSWGNAEASSRSALQDGGGPALRTFALGFRLVRP